MPNGLIYFMNPLMQLWSGWPLMALPFVDAETCLGNNICGNNGTGPVCGLCDITGVMTTRGCQPCPPEETIAPIRTVSIVIVSIIFLLFWIWFSWTPFFPDLGNLLGKAIFCLKYIGEKGGNLKEKLENLYSAFTTLKEWSDKFKFPQYFKIFVSFFQVTSSFISFQVQWPPTLLSALTWLKATVNFSVLALPGVSCIWRTISYRQKLLTYTISPLVFVALLGLPSLVGMTRNRIWTIKPGGSEYSTYKQRLDETLDRFWNGVMFSAFMLYPMLSLVVMEPFNCMPSGLGLLNADYREPCPLLLSFERLWTCVFILLYPVGIPIGSILVLRSMGVHDIARKKIEAATISAMIHLYIQRTTSKESQTITKIIGTVCADEIEFKRRVKALFDLTFRDSDATVGNTNDVRGLNIGIKRIKIKILDAKNLPKMDKFGSMDPFCILNFSGKKERTTVRQNTLNPAWDDEEFIFEIDRNMTETELTLTIEVFDWDLLGSNELTGTTTIRSDDIIRIIHSNPGYSECFRFDIDVQSEANYDDSGSHSTESGFCECLKPASTSNAELKSKCFQLNVQVESIEPVIVGSEISRIKAFSMMYDANQVTIYQCRFEWLQYFKYCSKLRAKEMNVNLNSYPTVE
jgi:hypothetical protein